MADPQRHARGRGGRTATSRDPDLLRELRGRVDVVVSNPPYVPAAVAVSPEVHADPGDAVFAGADGLDLIPTVIRRAGELLRPGGVLAMEHDETQDVRALFPADDVDRREPTTQTSAGAPDMSRPPGPANCGRM